MRRILTFLLCILILTGCTAASNTETTLPSTSTETKATEQTEVIPTEPSTAPTLLPTEPFPTETEPPTEPLPTETKPTEPEPTVPEPTDPVPTEPLDPIDALIQEMSLEERVGQLFLARCPKKNAVKDIQTYHLGGYVLFERDFETETPSRISTTIAAYQDAADIPLLITVDEEGGKVTRVSKYPAFRTTPFLSPREIYAIGGLEALQQNEEEKSTLLSSLGINVNLSPVCDITTDPAAFMYPRSLGESPEITGQFVQSALTTMKNNGIAGVLKHFPGYGNNTDTHIGIAVDKRSLAELEDCDLIPFRKGIEIGCGGIMVSHTFINAIDPSLPATLSPKVNAYLRREMGFDGVVITDDLVMQAITDLYGLEESAVMAVLAGNDILIATNYKIQYAAVLEAVRTGQISEQRINESLRRILQWKQDMGLLAT